MLTRRLSLFGFLLLGITGGGLVAEPAAAATFDGETLPDTYTVDGQTLLLNGIGVRTLTILAIRAYVAGLYLPQPNHDAQQILASNEPKVIILKFVHEAENCGGGACDPNDETEFEHLVAVAPAVKPGDTTTYVITSPRVRVYANDRLIDEFSNKDLAYRLIDGFIGAHPPTPALRRELLGLPPD